MKTKQQILDEIKAGRESKCLDGRDHSRLSDFFEVRDWPVLMSEIDTALDAGYSDAEDKKE